MLFENTSISGVKFSCTGFAFRFEHRKWNRGRNGLHQLGQPVAPSILLPVFKSECEPGTVLTWWSITHRIYACPLLAESA